MAGVLTFDVVGVVAPGVSWRIFELECLEKYFGQYVGGPPLNARARDIQITGAKYIFWKLHTESTDRELLDHCISIANNCPRTKHINDPRGWINCHAKERAFSVWQENGIPCPEWFEFKDEPSFWCNRKFDFPMLLRLNNSTSGWYSYLCYSKADVPKAIHNLKANQHYHHDGVPNEGVGRKFIAVQFIKTTRPENLNMSFRIIVAGDRVVTGYARLAPAQDWIAITNRFTADMQEPFIKYQKVCQKFCEEHEQELVTAVKCLGLNFQGVDVILDQDDQPYYIEVQPGFSVGYANRSGWHPPFYNPSKPEALVSFLKANLDRLREECPLYVNFWLDKYFMFNKAFAALKSDLG